MIVRRGGETYEAVAYLLCYVARMIAAATRQESQIQAVLDAHADAWTRGDAHAAAVMTDDSDWISGGGTIFPGRTAIEEMHRELLSGEAKGTRHVHPGMPSISFLRSDVAIVDGNSYVGAAGTQPTTSDFNFYTAVLVKEQGQWKVAAFRSLPQVKPTVTTLER
jgi:uncharacterized protein (TIGR02246 family)